MKKIQILTLAALMAFGLAGCSKENGNGTKGEPNKAGVAYLSIKVNVAYGSRASIEDPGTDESEIKNLYLVTFDNGNNIVGIPGGGFYATAAGDDLITPNAVKLSAAATNLVVIANPGAKLLTALRSLNSGSTFATFNAAIKEATVADLTSASAGFAMITGGDETGKTAGQTIDYPYVDIEDALVPVTGSEADAKTEAEKDDNRVPVSLERLTSKMIVKLGTVAKPDNSTFEFDAWTVDAVNTTYFPFAQKSLLGTTHTTAPNNDYTFNFYTTDPNFADVTTGKGYHDGIEYGYADSENNYAPKLPWNNYYDWKDADEIAYAVENTMAAAAQRYGNATRLVIRATYYPAPETFVGGEAEAPVVADNEDWFHWAGYNYTFETLKAAYLAAEEVTPLTTACDDFLARVKAVDDGITAANFGALVAADLASIQNGGDVVKDGTNAVIRWYQGGRNYYFYEIRHDNEITGKMQFGKYGIVRNNWYNLTLNNVSGPGTPWYPDLTDPGEGDPDPKDPIDEDEGYIGITVDVENWVLWNTDFGI